MTKPQRELLERISRATETGAGYYPHGRDWQSMTVLRRLSYVQSGTRAGSYFASFEGSNALERK